MRCHVALTPAEAAAAPLGIVVDVMRATSTIAQALAAGYRRVLCCAEIEDALALRTELGDEAITGGERDAKRVEAFDASEDARMAAPASEEDLRRVDYLADLGRTYGAPDGDTRRAAIVATAFFGLKVSVKQYKPFPPAMATTFFELAVSREPLPRTWA